MKTPNPVQAAEHIPQAYRTSPSRFPVSTRAYKKKDYKYLSTFPHMAASHAFLRVARSDGELSQARSDSDSSDLSMTVSTVGHSPTPISSSASSTSSSLTYTPKRLIASMDPEGHHQHQDMLSSARGGTDRADGITVKAKRDKVDDRVKDVSHADLQNADLHVAGDCSAPVQKGSTQVKASVQKPVVIPKFGSWLKRNSSFGESYTLFFERLKDEKESRGLPVRASPTHSNDKQPGDSSTQKGKATEALHANTPVPKNSSRQKGSGLPCQERTIPKHARRWNLCWKALTVDD